MSTTLGGTTLSEAIFDYTQYEPQTTTQRRMADGAFDTAQWSGSTKRGWHLSWRSLTAAEVATIYGEYTDIASQVFSPPDTASTFNVMTVRPSWSEAPIQMGSANAARYNVSFDVEEV